MTYATKAILKYGPLYSGALVCAALVGLGRFRVSPLLSGKVQTVALVALAIAMVIQGALIFPRKWASRLVISPHALLAGSVMLFAGAALLLVMIFAGCTPARGKFASVAKINFTAVNEQFRGACFAIAPLEALNRSCCRDDARAKAGPKTVAAVLDLGALDRRLCGSKPRQRVCVGLELTVAVSRRHQMNGVKT